MSRVSVAVSVVIAALLTVITAAMYRQSPADIASETSDALIPFDVQQADLLRVTYPDGRVVAAHRPAGSPDWWIFIDSPITSTRRVWPASAASVRTALRLLDDVAAATPPRDAPTPERAGAILHLESEGQAIDIELAPRTFAGRGLATLRNGSEARLVDLPAEVHDLAMNPGPEIWRQPLALPGLDTGMAAISRIQLDTPNRDLILARVEGRWYIHPEADLSQPGLPADAEAVRKLLANVASTRITRFVDDAAPARDAGLESPTAVLTLESSRRLPDAEPANHVRRLRIGAAADLDAKTLYGVLDDSDARAAAGERTYEAQLVALDAVGLSTIAMDAAAYLDPLAWRAPSSDLGAIIIQDADGNSLFQARQTLDGWRRVDADAERVPSPVEREMIHTLIDLLTNTPGEPKLAEGATAVPLCTIELRGRTGQPIGSYVFAQAPGENETTRPVLMTERVAWIYEPASADAIIRFLAE